MERIDLTIYPTKNQVSLIKSNPKIQRAMVESKSWHSLKKKILSLVIASDDALTFFEKKFKNN